MNSTARLLLIKSTGQFKHSGKYYLQNGRWHALHHDKPAPKGAAIAAHPHAAGAPAPKQTYSDAEWDQLKLPSENSNAGTFNKQIEQLKAAANAGDVTGILGSGYGTNTYSKKLVIIANHVLGLLGSTHTVTPGQKPGAHAAVQTAPQIEAGQPAPVEPPAAATPPSSQATPLSSPAKPKKEFTYSVKPATGGGFYISSDNGGGTVLAHKPTGFGILDNTPAKNFKTEADALAYMQKKGMKVAGAEPQPDQAKPDVTLTNEGEKPAADEGPKDGDTKEGADGQLVFKDGRWHKQEQAAPEVAAPAAPALAMPEFHEGKEVAGVKAYYEKVGQKVLDLAAAGDVAGLEQLKADGLKPNAKGKVGNTWKGKTENSKILLALHADAMQHAKGGDPVSDKKDEAIQAAVDHLKEDANQPDLPAEEKKEDAALVQKLEAAQAIPTKAAGKQADPDAESVPLLQIMGSSMLNPAVSALAFKGENPVWYSQQSPTMLGMNAKASLMGSEPSEHAKKTWELVQAAKAAGYNFTSYMKASGGLQGVYLLQKNGQVLTKKGAEALLSAKQTAEPASASAPASDSGVIAQPKGGNLSQKYWLSDKGPAKFQAASKTFGIFSADGKKALGKNGQPSSWGALHTVKEIAPHADQMVADGKHEWVDVYGSLEEANAAHQMSIKNGKPSAATASENSVAAEPAPIKKEPRLIIPKTAPAAAPAAGNDKLAQIPWDSLKLPDSNKNAKSHNKQVEKIKALAMAGDLAGLEALKYGTNTYAKKQELLKQTAIAALKEGGSPAAASPTPVNDALQAVKDSWKKEVESGNANHVKQWLQTYEESNKDGDWDDLIAYGKQLLGGESAPAAELSDNLIMLGIAKLKADQKISQDGKDILEAHLKANPGDLVGAAKEAEAYGYIHTHDAAMQLAAELAGMKAKEPEMPKLAGVWDGTAETLKKWSDEGKVDKLAEYANVLSGNPTSKEGRAAKQYAADLVAYHTQKPGTGPKEGDTKQGADGMLVFKNGRWHKQGYLSADDEFNLINWLNNGMPDKGAGKAMAGLWSDLTTDQKAALQDKASAKSAQNKAEIAGQEQPATVKKLSASEVASIGKVFKTAAGNKAKIKAFAVAGDMAGLKQFADNLSPKMPATKKLAAMVLAAMEAAPEVPAGKPKKASKPKAAAAPQAVTEPGGIESMDGWTQTGPQGGSNPGGRFKDANGVEWYCKFPADEDTAKAEVLAAKLYAALGIAGQDAKLITKGGKVGIASKWQTVSKAINPAALAKVDGVAAGFGADAWLANWDVVGMGYDNLQIGADGKAMRVDAGGSLMYRAQGGKKAFGATVTEIDSLRDPSINPQAAKVFSGLTDADITASVAKVLAISDFTISTLVHKYGPGSAADKQQLIETLIARKADLAAKFPAAAKKKAPKFKPEEISAPPDFMNWGGSGKSGPSSKPFLNEANHAAAQAIFEAAKTGDPKAVQALTAPIYNKDTGEVVGSAPVLEHPSQHIKGYAQQVINEINYQLNPPKKFRFDGGHPLHALNDAYPAYKGSLQAQNVAKVAKFINLGEPGQITLDTLGLQKKTYQSGSLTQQTYAKQAQAAIAKMPLTQKQAVKAYTGSSYHSINGSLWAGNPSGQAAAAAQALHTLAHDIEPGTILSRKISLSGSDLQQLLNSKGKVLQEPAIMSTSIRPSCWSGNVHLKLHVGPGVKGLWAGYGSMPGGGAMSNHAGEDEMILPPNTRLMIISVKSGGSGDADGFGAGSSHVVEAVILPSEGY